MLQNKFVRKNGDIIGSASIVSCEYTASVNSTTNLTVGDCTAAQVEVELRTPTEMITAGEKLKYIQIEDGVETVIGMFYAEAPTVASKTSIRFTAYDSKAKLEADFSLWLKGNQGKFPMPLRGLVGYACEVAGVDLAGDGFPYESLSIPAFYADGVTCRQVVMWAAQLAGRFVSCNTFGAIFFDWYRRSGMIVGTSNADLGNYSFSINDDGDLVLTAQGEMPAYRLDGDDLVLGYTDIAPAVYIGDDGCLYLLAGNSCRYMLDSLSKKDYTTDNIMRVQIKNSTDDVGVIYPTVADGNVFVISQNGLAALLESDTLREIAKSLYETLSSVTYTPLSFRMKRTAKVKPGDIIFVDGLTTYVMEVTMGSSGTTVASTGDQNYADKAAVASKKYTGIPGKVLEITKTLDGLIVRADDAEGNISKLGQTADGLAIKVEQQESVLTDLSLKAGKVDLTLVSGGGVFTSVVDVVDGEPVWNSEYRENGEVVSAVRWNMDEKKFEVIGSVKADSGEIGGWGISEAGIYTRVGTNGIHKYSNGGVTTTVTGYLFTVLAARGVYYAVGSTSNFADGYWCSFHVSQLLSSTAFDTDTETVYEIPAGTYVANKTLDGTLTKNTYATIRFTTNGVSKSSISFMNDVVTGIRVYYGGLAYYADGAWGYDVYRTIKVTENAIVPKEFYTVFNDCYAMDM